MCDDRLTKRQQLTLLGLDKGARQVTLEKNLPIVNGRTRTGKLKYVLHCCECTKKTPEELFDDEMLRSAGRENQIVEKLSHKGMTDGRPCCCVWVLSQCPDFAGQKNAVEEVCINVGHKVIFLPKYHPEFNFIEQFWGFCKSWLRRHCMYNMAGLWSNFERVFSAEVTPVSLIRKFARTSWRWMAAYRHNWSLELTTFATKIYHGHRGVPPTMDALMD